MKHLIVTAVALTLIFTLSSCSGGAGKSAQYIGKFRLHANGIFFRFCRGYRSGSELYGPGIG